MESLLVVKIGGNVIDAPAALHTFLDDFARLEGRKILIHGGGKMASELSRTLGIEPRLVEGRRLTDVETLKVVTMVYAGLINKNLVSGLQARGCNALGLTGADADLIRAKKRQHATIDYGFVGDPERVEVPPLRQFLEAGLCPVLAPLTHDGRGTMLNTNADTIAAVVVAALVPHYRVRLIYCFDKKGVLASADEDVVLSSLTLGEYRALQAKAIVSRGMIPKLDHAFAALQAGADAVILCHAADLYPAASGMQPVGTRLLR